MCCRPSAQTTHSIRRPSSWAARAGGGGGREGSLALAESCCSTATRDGRRLKLESKPKSELAIARFLSRGGGFCSSQADASLREVGLEALCPTHYNRTEKSCEPVEVRARLRQSPPRVQHMISGRRPTSCTAILSRCKRRRRRQPKPKLPTNPQPSCLFASRFSRTCKHKSIALICDASPKAKHDEPRLQIGVGLHWDYILWVTGRLRCGFQCSGFRIACVWELCSDCRRCCPVLLRHRRSWE